jgi:hypothetical protein
MVFPEADDLEPDERQAPPRGKILPLPSRHAPDWLMGPGEGLGATADPLSEATDEAPPETLPTPVLLRPGSPQPVAVPGLEPTVVPFSCPAPGEVPVRLHEEAAKVVEPEAAPPPARPRRRAPSGVWAPVASSVPALAPVLPDEPGPAQDEAPAPPLSARPPGLPALEDGPPRVAPALPALAALREPWWVIMLDTLRTSRAVQASVAGGLVGLTLLGYWMWPRGVGTTSLSDVRHYPSQFDGRSVVVRGRVGDDVFAVGSGWAFYLVQGRDTIVTFTRSQVPTPRSVITMKGQVSTGFLDGVPRQALFEDVSAAP